jgi:DNA-nicking Smr family endonuclease
VPAPGIAAPAKMPAPPPLVPLERRLRQRLAKGSERIDRRLDLHGLTQREAHDALARFLRAAQAEGAKVVLVVTGKGGRAADRDPFVERGVLRRLVPQWLHAREFRNLVVGFDAAHVGHGGAGALYVRLRRRRT